MGRRESGAGSWWWWGVSAVLLGVLVGRSENLVEARGLKDVTCGSVFKLVNHAYKIRLHSHDIKYGSGSGQQSVTGTDVKEDVNSNWAVKGGVKTPCTRGEPVECGSKVRLEHLQTGKNLHSHLFQSPLSGSQEISAFGDGGEGDTGDNWEIVCRGDFWERDEQIQFKHVDTGAYLSASGNTFGRPIHGQMEIVGVRHSDSASYWTASEGIFVHPSEMNLKSNAPEHNELNGMDGESPILVHIPPAKKKNMKTVLNAIQDRVSFAVGYPTHLYRMDGRRVRHPCELEQYSNYVVASNYDKHFKCVQYGRKKSPLLVLNRDSKHIRVLRLQNSHYRDWIMKKEATVEERPFAPHFYPPYANDNTNVSNTKMTGREGSYNNVNNTGQSDPTGTQTYRVAQQNPGRGPSEKAFQKDYVVQQCDVVTDNPQANQTLTRLQERAAAPISFGAHRTQYPTDLPKSEPFRTFDKPDYLTTEEPPVKKVQSLPEAIIDPYEQYRLPLPPSEFSKQQYSKDKVNSNVLNGNPAVTKTSYENFKDVTHGIHSDGGSSSVPNDSSSTSYEDLHEHNKYLLKQTRRKDRKLRKMFERNSSLMLAKGQDIPGSDCSETDCCGSVAIKETSRKDDSFKVSSRSKHLLVLPPPPPQFRDEIKLMLENSTGVVDKISFFVSQNQT